MKAALISDDPKQASAQQVLMTCPRVLVGRLIGKAGTTVKGIQLFTGAVIEIDQLSDPSSISIFGSKAAAATAESMIRDIIAGKFKGFALLRTLVALEQGDQPQQRLRPDEQYAYAPGVGLFPQRQVSRGLGWLVGYGLGRGLELACRPFFFQRSTFGPHQHFINTSTPQKTKQKTHIYSSTLGPCAPRRHHRRRAVKVDRVRAGAAATSATAT